MLKRLMEMFGRTPKNKKQNNISADVVNGDIIQDASVEKIGRASCRERVLRLV